LGVFDTREWTGDARVGGRWRASGLARGRPYTLEGEFREVDPPRKLVHTWQGAGTPGTPTVVTYLLEPVDGGTRINAATLASSHPTCAPTPALAGRPASSAWRTSWGESARRHPERRLSRLCAG